MEHAEKVLGPLLLGVGVNIYIFGLTAFQYAAYLTTPFNDRKHIKLSVFLLFLVDLFQSTVGIYIVWDYCVTNYAHPGAFEMSFWAYTIIPMSTGICGLIAHAFLAYRIYKLTKIMPALIMALVTSVGVVAVAFACSIVGLARQMSMMEIISRSDSFSRLMTLWLTLQTILDIALAAGLLVLLLRTEDFMAHLSRCNRVMRAMVQSGFLVAIFSLAGLLSYVGGFDTNVYLVFALSVGRLYSNLVLDTLLARGQSSTADSKSTARDIWIPSGSQRALTGNSFNLNSIHVQTEIYSDATARSKQNILDQATRSELPTKFSHNNEV